MCLGHSGYSQLLVRGTTVVQMAHGSFSQRPVTRPSHLPVKAPSLWVYRGLYMINKGSISLHLDRWMGVIGDQEMLM